MNALLAVPVSRLVSWAAAGLQRPVQSALAK